jgi:ribosomal-protein-alanine N-acetyltransferase
VISAATAADAAEIRRLVASELSPFDVTAELARSYAKLLVSRESAGSSICGCLLGWEVADETHVIDLVVAPANRRRGHARALLRTLLNAARSRGSKVALLEVRRSNGAALTLYASLGFEECGERRAYYPDGEDALLLRLELTHANLDADE